MLIVIAIIGILAAVAIPKYNEYKIRGYDAHSKQALHDMYKLCNAYWIDTDPSQGCDLLKIQDATYGFNQNVDVVATLQPSILENFCASAKHNDSPNTFSIDSAAAINTGSNCIEVNNSVKTASTPTKNLEDYKETLERDYGEDLFVKAEEDITKLTTLINGGTASTEDDLLIKEYKNCSHTCPSMPDPPCDTSRGGGVDTNGKAFPRCDDPTWISIYCGSSLDADGDLKLSNRGKFVSASAYAPNSLYLYGSKNPKCKYAYEEQTPAEQEYGLQFIKYDCCKCNNNLENEECRRKSKQPDVCRGNNRFRPECVYSREQQSGTTLRQSSDTPVGEDYR